MNKWFRSVLLGSLPALFGLATSANATALYFAYSYTGDGVASAGILTTTNTLVGGAYTITGIQGTRNVSDLSGLLAPGTFGANDNLLYPAGPFVDTAGFSFDAGGLSFNIANAITGCGSVNQYTEAPTGFCPGTAITLKVAAFTPTAGSAYFAYSYTGDGVASAGILTTGGTPVGGAYTITDIAGLRNGIDISGLLGSGTFGANDNLLYFPGGPYVDTAGFSYAAGGLPFNVANAITGCGSLNQYTESATGFCPGVSIAMNVTGLAVAVPEPATLFLTSIGLIGLGFSVRRKTLRA
jgi:hypothetical protein